MQVAFENEALHPAKMLQFADPSWVRRLARGATVFVFGIAVMVIAWMATELFFVVSLPLARHSAIFETGFILISLAVPLGLATTVAGVWLLTTPEPGCRTLRTSFGFGRVFGRVCAVFACIGCVLNLASEAISKSPSRAAPVILFLENHFWAVAILGLVALLHCVQQLCERVPDARLYSRARKVKFILLVCAAASVAKSFVRPSEGIPMQYTILEQLSPIIRIASVIVAIGAVLVIESAGRRLQVESSAATSGADAGPGDKGR